MRYLLPISQSNEIPGRQSYLYDIFHLYFLPKNTEGSFVELIPLGATTPDIMFITGHNNQVEDYLLNNIKAIPEKTIVATTCTPDRLRKYKNEKEIYVPNISGSFCYTRDGKPYGFEFNPSDAELNMYNATGDIMTRICSAYRRL